MGILKGKPAASIKAKQRAPDSILTPEQNFQRPSQLPLLFEGKAAPPSKGARAEGSGLRTNVHPEVIAEPAVFSGKDTPLRFDNLADANAAIVILAYALADAGVKIPQFVDYAARYSYTDTPRHVNVAKRIEKAFSDAQMPVGSVVGTLGRPRALAL